MWDKNSVYLKIETGYAFKTHMNDVFVNDFNIWTFNQDGNDSAILKIKIYNPLSLLFQHSEVEEEIKKIEVIRMRKGYTFDALT